MAFAVKWPERVKGIVIYDSGFPALRRFLDLKNWVDWEKYEDQLAQYGITRELDLDNPEPTIERFLKIPLPFGLRKGRKRKNPRLYKLVRETTAVREFQEIADLTEEKILSIPHPVLAVYGSSSPVAKVGKHLAENMSQCHVEYASGEDHLFVLKNPKIFLRLVEKFLEKHA